MTEDKMPGVAVTVYYTKGDHTWKTEIEKQNKKFGINLKLEDAVPLFYRLVENKCK